MDSPILGMQAAARKECEIEEAESSSCTSPIAEPHIASSRSASLQTVKRHSMMTLQPNKKTTIYDQVKFVG